MSDGKLSPRCFFILVTTIISLSLVFLYFYNSNQRKFRESIDLTPYRVVIDSLDKEISGLEDRVEEEESRVDSLKMLLRKSESSLDSIKKKYQESRKEIQNYKVEESIEFLKEYLKLEEL